MPPGGERLVVWLEFLVTDTFLIWNERWAIKSQSTQLKVATSSKCKMAALTYIQFANFVRKREHCRSALCSFKDWVTTKPTYKHAQTVCKFVWGKDATGCFSSSLTTEIRKSTTPFTSDWSFDGRERCWLLEGKATQQIKQQIENRPDNCILGTIIMHLLDAPLWQEIQAKPPEVLRWGVWTAGHETRYP